MQFITVVASMFTNFSPKLPKRIHNFVDSLIQDWLLDIYAEKFDRKWGNLLEVKTTYTVRR